MDENETHGGQTAMERLAREMAECVAMFSPNAWCYNHGVSVMGNYDECVKAVRSDIEHRIEDARAEDDCADSYSARELKRLTGMYLNGTMTTTGEVDEMVVAVEGWKAKAVELDALCLVLGTDDGDEALMVARELLEEHYELKELREAGRIMPEGVSWPRYEDGEPVRMGEPFVAWDGQESKVRFVTLYAPGPYAAWAINAGTYRNFVGGRDEAHAVHGLRLKRPAPKTLDKDGVEIRVGDTVFDGSGREWEVVTVSGGGCRLRDARPESRAFIEEKYIVVPSTLAHERPDSWERLREDARKDYTAYWGCIGFCCDKCPALVDGKKPNERYDTAGCHTAEQLDILARAERLAGVSADA